MRIYPMSGCIGAGGCEKRNVVPVGQRAIRERSVRERGVMVFSIAYHFCVIGRWRRSWRRKYFPFAQESQGDSMRLRI